MAGNEMLGICDNHVKWSKNTSPRSLRLVSQLNLETLMRGLDLNSKVKLLK